MLYGFILLTITGSVYDSSGNDVLFTILSLAFWIFLITFSVSRIIQFWPAVKGEKSVHECEVRRPSEETQILYWCKANSDMEIESVVYDYVQRSEPDRVRAYIKLLLEQNNETCPLDIDRLPLNTQDLKKSKSFYHEDGGIYGDDLTIYNVYIAMDIILALKYGLAYSRRCHNCCLPIRSSQSDSPKKILERRAYAAWLQDCLVARGKKVKLIERVAPLLRGERYNRSHYVFDPRVY